MRLKCPFRTMQIVGEKIAIPTGSAPETFRGAIRVNDIAADILKLLESDTTENEMVQQLAKEYDATQEQLLESVRQVVQGLRAGELLVE